MKKRVIGLILGMAMAATAMTGCGSSGNSADYVQGVLDVAYNKGTDTYVKAAGADKEDAKKAADSSLEAEAKVLCAYFGIEEPSEDVLDTFRDFAGKMYEKASYTVKEKGDGVEVVIKPLQLFDDEEVKQYVEDFDIKEFVDGDSSCTDEAFAKGITELLEKKLEKAEYGKEVTISVSVTEKDGKMTVSDEDLLKIDEQIVAY